MTRSIYGMRFSCIFRNANQPLDGLEEFHLTIRSRLQYEHHNTLRVAKTRHSLALSRHVYARGKRVYLRATKMQFNKSHWITLNVRD